VNLNTIWKGNGILLNLFSDYMLSPAIQEARVILATTKNYKAIKTGQLRQVSIFTQIL
jgi:Na+-transporting methylmalonyl-CoA/oxaloacetate decarboxylase beta subunit